MGNNVCRAMDDLRSALTTLGTEAARYQNAAQRDFHQFTLVTTQGAVNQNSIRTYNNAGQYVVRIEGHVNDLLKDQTCGSEAAMRHLQQYFVDQARGLIAMGQIAGKTGEAAAALQPALGEVRELIQQLTQIAGRVADRGPEAQKQYNLLMTSLRALEQQLVQVAALDVTGTLAAGGDLVTTVGPFMTNCAGCSAALIGAITSLGTGTAVSTGTVACPETFPAFGGTCWMALGLPVGMTVSALAGAVSSTPCASALEGAGRMAEYIGKIEKFVTTSARLARGISESATKAMTASEALAALARELGEESRPNVQAMAASLNRVGSTINGSVDIMATQVAPRIGGLAADALQQTSRNVGILVTCYNKANRLAAATSGEVMAGVADLTVATALLVDGGQIANNIYVQGQSGATAASRYAGNEFAALRSEGRRIHRALWGVDEGVNDPMRTLTHLGGFLLPPDGPARFTKLLQEIGALRAREAQVVARALEEGKKSFLNLESSKGSARLKFDQAGQRSQLALQKLQTGAAPPALVAAPQVITRRLDVSGLPGRTDVGVFRPVALAAPTQTTSATAARPATTTQPAPVTAIATTSMVAPAMRARGDFVAGEILVSLTRQQIAEAGALRVRQAGTMSVQSTFTEPMTVQIQLAIGPDGSCTSRRNEVFSTTTHNVAAGATASMALMPPVKLSDELRSRMAAGQPTYVTAHVDWNGQVAESSETNNCGVAQLR